MRILGIETSCDETAICIIEAEGSFAADFHLRILGNALISQIETHRPYGGVFPNLAKREHEKNLVPILASTLTQAALPQERAHTLPDLAHILTREPILRESLESFLLEHGKPEVDAIAVTAGPGLEPALWVGVNFAKALAIAWDLPLVAVNHLEGHVLMPLVETSAGTGFELRMRRFDYPLLALLISGGHTELLLSKEPLRYELLGATRDDAVGEAFDKVARLLGLPYPGGPEISALAARARTRGAPVPYRFPRPMLDQDNFDFSFSGLKTEVRRCVEAAGNLDDAKREMIALAFEDAAAEVLVEKTLHAADQHGARTLVVGGGVSANAHIRRELARRLSQEGGFAELLFSSPDLSTDNAVMIALAGYFRAEAKQYADPASLRAHGNLTLAEKH